LSKLKFAMLQFGEPATMKMAEVATIDSFRESIAGFQKVTNAHGYREERRNRGYQNSHFQKSYHTAEVRDVMWKRKCRVRRAFRRTIRISIGNPCRFGAFKKRTHPTSLPCEIKELTLSFS
jgi:hypothetical protein